MEKTERSDKPDHVIVVDDDAELRTLLAEYLGRQGYRVTTARDGRELRQLLERTQPDLIVLDIMLPGEDGFTICRDLRARTNIPIVMLTARNDEFDRILGIEIGADDYLAKPFNPRELLARIKSILRRARVLPAAGSDARRLRFGDWVLDGAARHLVDPTGVIIPLSGAEFRLLSVFVEHPNRVLDRNQLMDLTFGREATPFDRSIDVQVSRLRQRLNDDARDPRIIKTVRNGGYVLAANVERIP